MLETDVRLHSHMLVAVAPYILAGIAVGSIAVPAYASLSDARTDPPGVEASTKENLLLVRPYKVGSTSFAAIVKACSQGASVCPRNPIHSYGSQICHAGRLHWHEWCSADDIDSGTRELSPFPPRPQVVFLRLLRGGGGGSLSHQ